LLLFDLTFLPDLRGRFFLRRVHLLDGWAAAAAEAMTVPHELDKAAEAAALPLEATRRAVPRFHLLRGGMARSAAPPSP
jgi:hypothetical protein